MHNENNPQAPWLAHIPLDARHQQVAHVIVHPGRAVVPPEGLREMLRFDPDGQGGWVSAAQADTGRWGYVDGEGHWRVPPTLQNTRSFSDEGLGRFCQDGRWGFVDMSGAVVIAPAFADARPFRNGLSAVLVGDEDLAARHPDQVGWRIIDDLPLAARRQPHYRGHQPRRARMTSVQPPRHGQHSRPPIIH